MHRLQGYLTPLKSLASIALQKRTWVWSGIGVASVGLGMICYFRLKARAVEPQIRPDGDPKTSKTRRWLDWEARMLQKHEPLLGFNQYLAGFHPTKEEPLHQTEVHHFCKQVNEDFAQCILFDGNTRNANITGIEYVISEKLYRNLPADECALWHPHNYEVLSGQLIAPGLPSFLEKQVMSNRLNTYGKTIETWRTYPYLDTLPKGEARIGWSFNHDGQVYSALLENREKTMGVKIDKKKKERQSLAKEAKQQAGVNALTYKDPDDVKRDI